MTKDTESRGKYRTEAYHAVKAFTEARCGEHMTAQEVTEGLHAEGVKIGTATVYRQLCRLCEEGVLQKLAGADGKSACYRYAGDCRGDHYHLLCTECGKLTHLSCDSFSDLYDHVGKEHGFHIDGSRTVFYGVCAGCYRAKKQLHGENQ